MLMLMFSFLKVSLKYGSTGVCCHAPRYYYFPFHMLENVCDTTVSVKSDCLI